MFDNLTMKQLRDEARKYGIKPYSRGFRVKAGLVLALKKAAPQKNPVFAANVRKDWIDNKVARDYPYCCQFAGINEDWLVSCHAGAPCHAQLSYMARSHFLIEDVSNHYNNLGRLKEQYKEWVLYWLNDSPMSYVFETKTWEEAFEYGVLIDGRKHGVSEIAVALIGMREGSEFSNYRLSLFSELLDKGFDKRLAWLLSCNFYKEKESYMFKPWNGAHEVMNSYGGDPETFFSWLKTGKMIDKGSIFSEVRGVYKVSRAISKAVREPHDLLNLLMKMFSVERSDGWATSYKVISAEAFQAGVEKLKKHLK